MKLKLIQQILNMTKYMFYGLLVQVFLSSFLTPKESHGQKESVYEITIDLNAKGLNLGQILQKIEYQTDFEFNYFRSNEIPFEESKPKTDRHYKNTKLSTVLGDLSSAYGLHFKRVNNRIAVRKAENETNSVEEVIKEEVVQIRVNGKVSSQEGEPLPGVSILIKGSSTGTITDMDGVYSLNVTQGDILQFSFIGFKTQEATVTTQTTLNIVLLEDLEQLEEVVVVGFGTQEKVNLTGAVSTVNAKELENRPITNASQALQGIQGLYVNQAGGQPGRDGTSIRIRGIGTLNNSNPLVLVDGIEFSLNDLNPNDIESISVLKDAASAAIYGSRAANGVILVTTKTGKSGRSEVSYNNYFGIQNVISLPDVVRDLMKWFELYNQAMENTGRSPQFSQDFLNEFESGMTTDPLIYPNNDWDDIMFDPAFMQEHSLRFSGGSEKTKYTMSLGYMQQDGVMRGTSSERYNLNLNLNSQVHEMIKVGANINTSLREFDEPAGGVPWTMQMILKAQSFHPTYLEDGRYGDLFYTIPGHRNYRHPLVLTDEGENDFRNLRLYLNTFAEISLPFDIKYKLNLAINNTNQRQKRFVPQVFTYNIQTGAISREIEFIRGVPRSVFQSDTESLNTTIFNTLNWNKTFDNNEISVLIGQSAEYFQNSFFTASNQGFLSNDLTELNAGSINQTVSGSSNANSITSYFGRVNYILKDKYLFETNFRYDGSSRFAKGNRWGFFPSFSVGWRMEEEAFLQDLDWLSQLKVRASWGQLGNERIGNFQYADLMTLGLDYVFGNDPKSGAAIIRDNDDEISWETTTITNFGVDASFFEGRFDASFEYFIKTTDDILRPIGIPAQVGNLGGPVSNIGSMQNNGIEISLAHRNKRGNFSYEVNGNLTYITNEVTKLNNSEVIINSLERDGLFSITQEGAPINQYLLFQSDGIFQTQEEIDNHAFQGNDTRPGYIRYKDINNDGFINSDDRVATGNTFPTITYTFNINVGYKNFSLATFWQGVEDIQTYNNHISGVPFWFGTSLPSEWVNNSWTPENPNASLPILTRYQDATTTNFRPSDFWLLDASYLRLKNVQLSYDFNQAFLDKLGLGSLRFFVNGQNLLTFTDLKNFDPEQNISDGNFFEYPSVRAYTVGLNVTF